MKHCGCYSCNMAEATARDTAFWLIVEDFDVSTDAVDRIKQYSESPRATTPEDFHYWLETIIDRARRRAERPFDGESF